MTETLSTIATVATILTGLVAIAAFWQGYLRGRDRMRVGSSTLVSENAKSVQIVVTNIGAKKVNLTEIGFAVLQSDEFSRLFRLFLFPFYLWLRRRRRYTARRYSDLGVDDGEEVVVTLEPTERHVVTIPMDFFAGWLSEGEVAWPYAQDTSGRQVYSASPAYVERLSESGQEVESLDD